VSLFNETIKKLEEIHCWKGYRKVGTKMKNGKRVNDCRPIKENFFPVLTDFTELPDSPPYGFWTWKNKFVIAKNMNDHEKILREIMPGEYQSLVGMQLETQALNLGLVRGVKEGGIYHLNYVKGVASGLKTAKDIALWYNIKYQEDSAPARATPSSPSPSDDIL